MAELSDEIIEEARRLTRLARKTAADEEADAYHRERDRLLESHGYEARVREEETRAILVLYPTEWIEDGTVQPGRLDELDRAIELPLSETVDEEAWEDIDGHNRSLAAAVEKSAGPVHGANATAFAVFLANHYLRTVEEATAVEVTEFLEEYYPRNTWPNAEQRVVVEESLRRLFEAADREPPEPLLIG